MFGNRLSSVPVLLGREPLPDSLRSGRGDAADAAVALYPRLHILGVVLRELDRQEQSPEDLKQ